MVAKQPTAPEIKMGYDAAVFDILPPTVPVQIKPGENAAPVEETASAQLRAGATVKTTTNRAQVTIRAKKDVLRLPEQSEIQLVKFSPDAEQVLVRVTGGSLWTDVSPRSRPGDFTVETPDMTAGVKGTRFRVDVLPNQGTIVSVDEGAVEVVSRKAPVSTTVRANQAVMISWNGQLSEAIKIDLQKSQDAWDRWADEASLGVTGASTFSRDLVKPMADQVAMDNARWTGMMEEANRTIAENKFLEQMDKLRDAFMKLAQDTGHVPDDNDAWVLLKENTRGLAGWAGPYLEGPIPPADPWGNCLVYRKRVPPSGNVNAIIYTFWSDKVDSKGQMPGDRFTLVPFYQAPAIKNSPNYNVPRQ